MKWLFKKYMIISLLLRKHLSPCIPTLPWPFMGFVSMYSYASLGGGMFMLLFVIIKYFISFSFFFRLLVIITYLQIVRIGIASQLNFTSLYIFDHKLAISIPYFPDYTESTIYSLLLNKNKYKFWDIQKTTRI